MSLTTYNKLGQDPTLETRLPQLTSAQLSRTEHSNQTAKEVINLINSFEPQQGWVSYRDKVEITASAPINEYFIEAQYCRGENSLHIKLTTNNRYQVIQLNVSKVVNHSLDTTEKVYQEQNLVLRNHFQEEEKTETVTYRLWWQQDNNKESQHFGRWLPLAQQFVGFTFNAQGEK